MDRFKFTLRIVDSGGVKVQPGWGHGQVSLGRCALSLSLSLSLPVHEKGFFLVLSLPGQQLHVSILFILCQQEGFCTRDQTLLCSVPVGLWYKALAR